MRVGVFDGGCAATSPGAPPLGLALAIKDATASRCVWPPPPQGLWPVQARSTRTAVGLLGRRGTTLLPHLYPLPLRIRLG